MTPNEKIVRYNRHVGIFRGFYKEQTIARWKQIEDDIMAVDVIFVCDEVGNVDAEDQRKLEEIGKIKDDNNNSDKVNQTCAKEDQGHVEDILDG